AYLAALARGRDARANPPPPGVALGADTGQADRADRSSVGGSGGCLMLAISATEAWRTAHPGATSGLLELSGLENTGPSTRLNERKRAIEAGLRERYKGFPRQDFLALP